MSLIEVVAIVAGVGLAVATPALAYLFATNRMLNILVKRQERQVRRERRVAERLNETIARMRGIPTREPVQKEPKNGPLSLPPRIAITPQQANERERFNRERVRQLTEEQKARALEAARKIAT